MKSFDTIGTGRVPVIVSATPERIDSIPSVTRKDGIRSQVTSNPEKAPTTPPKASVKRIAGIQPNPAWSISAPIMPDRLAIDPTERSISAEMITNVMPTAMIETIAVILRMASAVVTEAKLGAVNTK